MDRGDFTACGLGCYRILFASYALVRLPHFSWAGGYPTAFHSPPPGPFAVLPGFPPRATLIILEVAVAVCFASVLVGWRTRPSSYLAALLTLVGYGITYSFGKIDHNILFVLAPAFMAYAGWGSALSVDAARRNGDGGHVRPWAMRLFALAIGMAFATAALPKWRNGWMSVETQAVRNELARSEIVSGTDTLGTALLHQVDVGIFWNALDWMTVAFELGLVASAIAWLPFRVFLAIAALFHLAVFVTFDIRFSPNMLAYAAFVRWDLVHARVLGALDAGTRLIASGSRPWIAIVVVSSLASTLAPFTRGVGHSLSAVVICAGAAVGAAYLYHLAVRLALQQLNGRQAGA